MASRPKWRSCFALEDTKTKMMKDTPYELLKDDQKKQLGKNNKAKMTFYNALPRKKYKRFFMCKTVKEGVKKYEKFDICKEKTKGGESSRRECSCYNCGNKNHFTRTKESVGGAWSDSKDGNEP
nr:zf-CCHC domain-containing protein/DUF4219 domain-containing protein/UBN2 domain-containing protein [Tanacetum cinerariifolium]